MGCAVDKPGQGVPSFNATGLVRDLLRLDWPKYRIMSTFAHANLLEVMHALKKQELQEGEPERFGLAYEDDLTLVELVLPFLQFLLLAYLRFVREFAIGTSEVSNAVQLAESDQAIEWAKFLLAANPSPYWTQVVADLDYMFQVLALADRGGGWQAVRDQRPRVTKQTEAEAEPRR